MLRLTALFRTVLYCTVMCVISLTIFIKWMLHLCDGREQSAANKLATKKALHALLFIDLHIQTRTYTHAHIYSYLYAQTHSSRHLHLNNYVCPILGSDSSPDQQQQFQSMQMLTPPFPPNLSEEELQEFLSKPENQPALKVKFFNASLIFSSFICLFFPSARFQQLCLHYFNLHFISHMNPSF